MLSFSALSHTAHIARPSFLAPTHVVINTELINQRCSTMWVSLQSGSEAEPEFLSSGPEHYGDYSSSEDPCALEPSNMPMRGKAMETQ